MHGATASTGTPPIRGLTAIGFPLPDSARRWAHRPPPQPRPRRSATPRALLDDGWIMIDGRPYFVAGYTSGGAPYGIYLDEMDDDHLTGIITGDLATCYRT